MREVAMVDQRTLFSNDYLNLLLFNFFCSLGLLTVTFYFVGAQIRVDV